MDAESPLHLDRGTRQDQAEAGSCRRSGGTGLDNTTLLVLLKEKKPDYVMINHARWEPSLPRFAWQQFNKKSVRSYVLANLRANHIRTMPVLYQLA